MERSVFARDGVAGLEEMNRQSAEDFQGSEIIQCGSIMVVDTCLYTFAKSIECTAPRVNPNVNYRLRVIITCPCRFIHCNKWTPLVQGADSGGGCVY